MTSAQVTGDQLALVNLAYDYGELLDRSAVEEWLGLFGEEATYRIIQRHNHDQRLPLYLVNDDRKRLMDRIVAYRGTQLPATLHAISNVRIEQRDEVQAEIRAVVLVLRRGELTFSGRYFMSAVKMSNRWIIHSCLVVLEGEIVPENLPLPI